MQQIYVAQTENGVSTCNFPFKENAVIAQPMLVTADEMRRINDPSVENKVENGKFVFEEIPLGKVEQARQKLKDKLENGTYTPEDIVEALKLIL